MVWDIVDFEHRDVLWYELTTRAATNECLDSLPVGFICESHHPLASSMPWARKTPSAYIVCAHEQRTARTCSATDWWYWRRWFWWSWRGLSQLAAVVSQCVSVVSGQQTQPRRISLGWLSDCLPKPNRRHVVCLLSTFTVEIAMYVGELAHLVAVCNGSHVRRVDYVRRSHARPQRRRQWPAPPGDILTPSQGAGQSIFFSFCRDDVMQLGKHDKSSLYTCSERIKQWPFEVTTSQFLLPGLR